MPTSVKNCEVQCVASCKEQGCCEGIRQVLEGGLDLFFFIFCILFSYAANHVLVCCLMSHYVCTYHSLWDQHEIQHYLMYYFCLLLLFFVDCLRECLDRQWSLPRKLLSHITCCRIWQGHLATTVLGSAITFSCLQLACILHSFSSSRPPTATTLAPTLLSAIASRLHRSRSHSPQPGGSLSASNMGQTPSKKSKKSKSKDVDNGSPLGTMIDNPSPETAMGNTSGLNTARDAITPNGAHPKASSFPDTDPTNGNALDPGSAGLSQDHGSSSTAASSSCVSLCSPVVDLWAHICLRFFKKAGSQHCPL